MTFLPVCLAFSVFLGQKWVKNGGFEGFWRFLEGFWRFLINFGDFINFRGFYQFWRILSILLDFVNFGRNY